MEANHLQVCAGLTATRKETKLLQHFATGDWIERTRDLVAAVNTSNSAFPILCRSWVSTKWMSLERGQGDFSAHGLSLLRILRVLFAGSHGSTDCPWFLMALEPSFRLCPYRAHAIEAMSMPQPCKPWRKLGGCNQLEADGGLILPLLTSPAVLHLCRSTLRHVFQWLVTFVFHVPLQGIRLSTFFARLALYIAFLWPAMVCGLIYWAFAGKNILSVRYKDRSTKTCQGFLMAWFWKFLLLVTLLVRTLPWQWLTMVADRAADAVSAIYCGGFNGVVAKACWVFRVFWLLYSFTIFFSSPSSFSILWICDCKTCESKIHGSIQSEQ